MGAAPATVHEPEMPSLETGPIGRLFASQRARAIITPLLRGVPFERMVSEIHILARKKPDILKCTGESIIMSVADCLRHDLVFGETAHMVPFDTKVTYLDADRNEREKWELRAQFIVGWKGAIELVVRSGSARDVDAQCVYANELPRFAYRAGSDPDVQHWPILQEEDRGPLVGAYAIARITQSHKKVVWKPAKAIDALRQKYSKANKKGPLEDWYARKTVILQLCNRLPRNIRLDQARALIQSDPDLDHVEEITAEVSDASVPPQRMLTEGAVQPIDTRRAQRQPAWSDDERAEMMHRELRDIEDVDPRGPDGHKAPF